MEAATACCVIVVAESDKLNRMAQSAVDKMGARLRLGRAVKAEAKRFAERMSARPKLLHVEVFDVVGFSSPVKDRPDILEPIVIEDGRATLVTNTYIGVLGEYRVVLSAKLDGTRGEIIASCARSIARLNRQALSARPLARNRRQRSVRPQPSPTAHGPSG